MFGLTMSPRQMTGLVSAKSSHDPRRFREQTAKFAVQNIGVLVARNSMVSWSLFAAN